MGFQSFVIACKVAELNIILDEGCEAINLC
jgi:hypothetical protein